MSIDPWPTAADVAYVACVASVSVRLGGKELQGDNAIIRGLKVGKWGCKIELN